MFIFQVKFGCSLKNFLMGVTFFYILDLPSGKWQKNTDFHIDTCWIVGIKILAWTMNQFVRQSGRPNSTRKEQKNYLFQNFLCNFSHLPWHNFLFKHKGSDLSLTKYPNSRRYLHLILYFESKLNVNLKLKLSSNLKLSTNTNPHGRWHHP
jgi:hypothetical protein